jgi:hypothetical protein
MAVILLTIACLAVAACGEVRPLDGSAGAVASGSSDSDASAPSDRVRVDPTSQELLALMDPTDTAHVVIGTTWTDEFADAATDAKLRFEVYEPGASVAIDGPIGRVMDLVERVPVTSVSVTESSEALRPIPDRRPDVTAPRPGHPYLLTGFGDLPELKLASPARETLLRSLAQTVQTIDGQPYPRLEIDGACGESKAGASCALLAVGYTAGSVGRDDEWSIDGTPQGGWIGRLDRARLWSVPRAMVRAAEWDARHDGPTLARIRAYSWCCEATWDPAAPGRIILVYSRLCTSAARPGRDIAETGECRDELSVTVDLGAERVTLVDGPA